MAGRSHQAGFRAGRRVRVGGITLIELLIVVTVLGMLTTFATSAYYGYARRAHRTEAQTALTRLAVNEQNHRNVHQSFTADLDALGFPGGCSEHCVYTIDFTLAPDTRTFTARARPTPGGGMNGVDQSGDADCQWFTINARGVRDAGPGADCWGR